MFKKLMEEEEDPMKSHEKQHRTKDNHFWEEEEGEEKGFDTVEASKWKVN